MRRGEKLLMIALMVVVLFSMNNGITYLVLLFCILSFITIPHKGIIDKNTTWLLLFSISFFTISFFNSNRFEAHSLIYLIAPLFFYLVGRHFCELMTETQLEKFFLILILFMGMETYLLTIQDIKNSGLINATRLVFRSSEDVDALSATLFGVCVSLGFAGLPICFTYDRPFHNIKAILFFASAILSTLTVIHLVNRSGLVILLCCFMLTYSYYSQWKLKQIAPTLLILGILSFFIFNSSFLQDVSNAYLSRLDNEHSSYLEAGGRTWRWIDAVGRIFTDPLGWANNSKYAYVHNLWLDVAMFTGIIPFFAILKLTINNIKSCVELTKYKNNRVIAIIISLNVCMLLTCFVEPIMQGDDVYFYVLCLIWGFQNKYLERVQVCQNY